MRRILFILLFLFIALTILCEEPVTQESAKAKLNSLEGLLKAKESVNKARWEELKKIDKVISYLWEENQSMSEEPPSEVKNEKLLDLEEKLNQLHQRRLFLLEQIRINYEEQIALKGQIKSLKEYLISREQVLDGKWNITFMPSGLKGDVYLSQNGTIVEGEYLLENGQKGNLQGVFIRGHLVLERIDSEYGKMGKWEAQISKDYNSFKGTWYSYDIQSGEPLTGALVLERSK